MEEDTTDAGTQPLPRKRMAPLHPVSLPIQTPDENVFVVEQPNQANRGRQAKQTRVKKIPLSVQAIRVGRDVVALLARVTLKIISFKVPFVKPCIDAVLEDDEQDEMDGIIRPQTQGSLGAEPPEHQTPGMFRRAWNWCCQKTGSVWRYFGGQRNEIVHETPE